MKHVVPLMKHGASPDRCAALTTIVGLGNVMDRQLWKIPLHGSNYCDLFIGWIADLHHPNASIDLRHWPESLLACKKFPRNHFNLVWALRSPTGSVSLLQMDSGVGSRSLLRDILSLVLNGIGLLIVPAWHGIQNEQNVTYDLSSQL